MKSKRGNAILGGLVLAAFIFLAFTTAYAIWKEGYAEPHAAYQAWAKVTGNPKQLTYEEWRAYRNMVGVKEMDK